MNVPHLRNNYLSELQVSTPNRMLFFILSRIIQSTVTTPPPFNAELDFKSLWWGQEGEGFIGSAVAGEG